MSKAEDKAVEAIRKVVAERVDGLSVKEYQGVLRELIDDLKLDLDASVQMDKSAD